MTKKVKIALCVTVPLLLLIAAFCLSYFVWQLPLFDRSGWMNQNGTAQYLDYYGRPKTGWQTVENNRYYFGADGVLRTGWQTIENSRYYFGTDGVLRTGWQTVDSIYCYFGDDGALRTGWQDIDGKRYYFRSDGQMHTGYLEDAGQYFYLTEDGTPYIGWLDSEGKRTYYAAPNGQRHSGWLQLPEGTYYLDAEGDPQTGWIEVDGRRHYLKPDGILNEAWQHDGKQLRYIVDGKPYSGWYRGEEGVYWFDGEGVQKTGWITDEAGRFYLYADGTFATGFVEINGVERYFLPSGEYIVLCNRWNPVPEDYELNLVSVGDHRVDASCAGQLKKMMEDAKADGVTIKLNDSYRSIETQQSLREVFRSRYIKQGMSKKKAEAEVEKTVAVPGTSEHHTGFAIDVAVPEKVRQWMEKNSWKYGFIVRYPSGKTEITGIIYEPWHFRYVGVEMAKAVTESGLCLEEYLEKLKTA